MPLQAKKALSGRGLTAMITVEAPRGATVGSRQKLLWALRRKQRRLPGYTALMRWPRIGRRSTERRVKCATHGTSLPTFVCIHLLHGEAQGFFHADEMGPDEGRPNAWCGACEERRIAGGGEWNDETEPQVSLACTDCWDTFQRRNATAD